MSKAPTFSPFDAADYLKTEDDLAAFLEAAAEDGDAAHYARALGTAARARLRMTDLARRTGFTRQGLIKGLAADGNPSLDMTMRVMRELGYRFDIVRTGTSAPARPAGPKARKIPPATA